MPCHRIVLPCLCLCLCLLMPVSLFAQNVSGRVELTYTRDSTTTEDAAGDTTKTKSDSFMHLYSLSLNRQIYPNVTLLGGALFSQTIANNETDSSDEKSTADSKNGYLELRQGTRSLSSGISYNIWEDKVDVRDSSSLTSRRENYTATLGMRPEGLPSLNALLQRSYTYDKERDFQDDVQDSLFLGMKYEPYRDLDLRYNANLSRLTDRLNDREVIQTDHGAIATYRRKLGKRVSMNTSYHITQSRTKVTIQGTGEVLFPVFPFSGLSGLSDTPDFVTLDLNPALVDGIFTSAGINIGKVPIGGDTSMRNMGVDFINLTELNTIYVWVDRDLPDNVINAFSWDIYISSDNLNWTLLQTVSPAKFGTFDNRFEISFSTVETRYIKVVTKPLSPAIVVPPGFDVNNILVTELQTFLRRSAQDAEEARGTTTHLYDLNVKWNILDSPDLFYDFYYWTFRQQPEDVSRYIISNGLNVRHRFSRFLSGSARVAREDIDETTGKTTAHLYSASLTATPLPTLWHSLIVSGRYEDTSRGSTDSNSVFLNNRAALYRGLDLLLSGGVSLAHDETDRRTLSTVINSGLTAKPHPAIEMNLTYYESNGEQTGGGLDDITNFSRRTDASVSYTPFDTVYMFASYGIFDRNDQDRVTLQNYEVTWSPFPDGDLSFNFQFTETLNSENDSKTRTVSPSMRWRVMRNAYLDVSYIVITDKSVIQNSETKIFSSTLSMTL